MSKPTEAVKRFHSECIDCLLNKSLSKADLAKDEATRLEYMQGILKILSQADISMSPPQIIGQISALQKGLLNYEDNFEAEKAYFNSLMLSKEPLIWADIEASAQPLHTALNYAMLGNFIDFGAMDSVDKGKLNQLLDSAKSLEYDDKEYLNLINDLKGAKRLIYLTDNCGEIVADKLFIKTILKHFPHLWAEVMVKGKPVLNDATLKDAKQIGFESVVKVSHNGSNLAGTCLDYISAEAKDKIDSADIIIAKGQANFETLRHCGKNIYYIFMCKCKLFAERFNVPRLSGMLLNDLRL